MNKMLKLTMVAAFALLIAAPAALAQTPEVSTLPVTEPLDVGGTVLQPGTYTIRVVPTLGDRNRVQITSTDLATIYATVLTVPHDLEPNEEIPNTRFVFFPAGEGMPRALRTWFPPNSAMDAGHDIVYEESRAKQLARLASGSVVSYRDDTAVAELDDTELRVITPEATFEPYTPPAPQMSSVQTTTETRTVEMPATAGSVPMIALFGLLSLGAAIVVRFVR